MKVCNHISSVGVKCGMINPVDGVAKFLDLPTEYDKGYGGLVTQPFGQSCLHEGRDKVVKAQSAQSPSNTSFINRCSYQLEKNMCPTSIWLCIL
ncbi:hypothetical protein O6P43_029810 [Quillaja saponaria]|uniref:Uncharacterized protein n=1 Tax=Quillaja saponaria TaxID=32244 RepID=A0AAD7PBW5_QUISA|nr:hypothetical protein O6P43_029810 [Quillaja saponaria]